MEPGSKIHWYKAANARTVFEHFYSQEDEDWHRFIHENGRSWKENVEDSLNTISEGTRIYCVECDGELAGFFSKYEDEHGNLAMEAFHIGIKFRTRKFIPVFWGFVKEVFERDFWIGVFEQNAGAVAHLERQGFELHSIQNHRQMPAFIYKVKN